MEIVHLGLVRSIERRVPLFLNGQAGGVRRMGGSSMLIKQCLYCKSIAPNFADECCRECTCTNFAFLDVKVSPWEQEPLNEWSICGMNHYRVQGVKFLFISMVKGDRCITVEGRDSIRLWDELSSKAEHTGITEVVKRRGE